MGRKATTKKRRLNVDVRRRLLDTARPLLCMGSIHDQKISDIIDHVGVSKSTFYEHFISKDDLILSITNDILSSMETCIAILDNRNLPLVERLIRHLMRISDELSMVSDCMLGGIRQDYPELGKKIDKMFSFWERKLHEFVNKGISQNVFEKYSSGAYAKIVITSFQNTCMSLEYITAPLKRASAIRDIIRISVKSLIRADKISYEKISPLLEKRFSLRKWDNQNNVPMPVNCARSLGLPCPSGICG